MERLFRMSKKEIPTDTEGKLQQLRNDICSDLPLDPIKRVRTNSQNIKVKFPGPPLPQESIALPFADRSADISRFIIRIFYWPPIFRLMYRVISADQSANGRETDSQRGGPANFTFIFWKSVRTLFF